MRSNLKMSSRYNHYVKPVTAILLFTVIFVLFLFQQKITLVKEYDFIETFRIGKRRSDVDNNDLLDMIRSQRALIEELSCQLQKIGARGGFCLTKEQFDVGGNWVADYDVAKFLERTIFRRLSIGDFGAGLGWYGRYWLRNNEALLQNGTKIEKSSYFTNDLVKEALRRPKVINSWEGFDGAGNVEGITNKFVKFLDLSEVQYLPKRYDWVVSLEVAEHIPKEFEKTFLDNLDNHACQGIVLSWAVIGQGGHHHVNCRSNEYVKKEMAKRNFINELETEKQLRKVATLPWFKDSLMVFKRKNLKDDPQCRKKLFLE